MSMSDEPRSTIVLPLGSWSLLPLTVSWGSALPAPKLGQHRLGNRLQGVEHAGAAGRAGLEFGRLGGIEHLTQLVERRRVRQVALVVLDDVRQLVEVVPLVGQVEAQVVERLDVRLHALDLRVGDE